MVTLNKTTSASMITDTNPTPIAPAVVKSSNGATLADKLSLKDLPLATTPGGKAFALKALHPSEHTIKSARVPGGNLPSIAINSDQVFTIDLGPTEDSVRVVQSANPLVPCMVEVGQNGLYSAQFNFFNAALGGTVYNQPIDMVTKTYVARFIERVSAYRITSQSVTLELIAPALTDQGTVMGAQYVITPRSSSICDYKTATCEVFTGPDQMMYPLDISEAKLMLGTSAYTSRAREGCYQPLKLTDFKWHNANDLAMLCNVPYDAIPSSLVTFNYSTSTTTFPFYIKWDSISNDFAAQCFGVPKCCGDKFGFIYMNGVQPGVSVRVRVRQVMEIVGLPGSVYAPLVEPALPADKTAIKMYMEVSSRMKDGYPASYNDLGKLFDVVKSIAKGVLPFVDPVLDKLSQAPGLVGTIASIGKGAFTAARKFIPGTYFESDKPSAGLVEVVQPVKSVAQPQPKVVVIPPAPTVPAPAPPGRRRRRRRRNKQVKRAADTLARVYSSLVTK